MKKLYVQTFPNSRALINFVNDNKIQHEDIVNIFRESGEYQLFYYN